MSRKDASTNGPQINVSPNPSLVDDNLRITATGLQPGQDVTLLSRMGEMGHRFYGYAHFRGGDNGIVHNNMESQGGTYTGIITFSLTDYYMGTGYSGNRLLPSLSHRYTPPPPDPPLAPTPLFPSPPPLTLPPSPSPLLLFPLPSSSDSSPILLLLLLLLLFLSVFIIIHRR